MPRQARLDAPGTLHHVIIRGIEQRSIVEDREDREEFVSRMGQIATETGTVIYAWSLMTNHAHILVRSAQRGLAEYMRRVLTGYAIAYNRRHRRYGHLFQNRYKSIVCDEDVYFCELVRYIHLNPVRVRLVKDISELGRYPWSGHRALMGREHNAWQPCAYVLSWFGKQEAAARRAYQRYMREGVEQGRRPGLVGGGLIRSLGGWSQVRSLRKKGGQALTDERILGGGAFVEKVLKDADEKVPYQFTADGHRSKIAAVIQEACDQKGINEKELRMGSRRGQISTVRSDIARRLVKEYGIPLAEVARQVGVTTSAISNMLRRDGA